ncbi:branched-chain amino acid ABC transporter permease [Nakamurella endophytica]|uniref:Branched-chain amino acid ABC transporter permease n=1 Tax=Nakamurella endophytica TaxID=1748367 RepID=A0A917WFS8_9ACTN|nr:branched-chain amino acid ABC transporter permease [Nakamurella endophytica]GGL99041.1 branched-chain amino acid ABC transporter permease [Nakamurella endophytica]
MDAFAAILLSGLVLGSLYGLMASGLSLMWSTLGVFNFGHGVLLALGAYFAWTFTEQLDLPVALAAVLAVVVLAVVGVVYEIALVRPFIRRENGAMLVMVATLAVTALVQSVIQLLWGPQLRRVPQFTSASVSLSGATVSGNQLVALVAAPVLVGALFLVLKRSPIGIAVRALEQNRDHARLVGIRPAAVYVFVVVIACVLAAFAGVLLAGIQFMTPTMGDDPLLRAFVVLAFGGTASLGGTLAGAYLIGLLEAATTYFFGLSWSPVLLFLAMIVVLLLRPEGLIRQRTA